MDPASEGPLYCAEQIKIPAELPDILKEFTKAAIRTQPADLLQWATAYFEALSKGDVPPVKVRLEQTLPSPVERLGGLSKGALNTLHKQLGSKEAVSLEELEEKWKQNGCSSDKLKDLLAIGNFSEDIEWHKLLALACTALEQSLTQALTTLCEILTPAEEGGAARIPLEQFQHLYTFLAEVDGEISKDQVATVIEFLSSEANRYEGNVGPREFTHTSCPRLDSRSAAAHS